MKNNKNIIQVSTESDTQLFLQIAETEESNKKDYEVALTLSTETGADSDGEQTTFLSSSQVDELIEKLKSLQYSITRNKLNNSNI